MEPGSSREGVEVTATDAKREFASILEKAIRGSRVVITKHGAPKAVLLSVEDFRDLEPGVAADLESLRREFDQMFARMQTRKARAGMKAAFGSSPARLGRAAAGTRKRG
jgi:prevent-host-death family protein